MKALKYSLIILFLSIINLAHAIDYTVETIPNVHLANARDFVSNPDNIISQRAVDEINKMLFSVQSANTAEIAVVLVNSIGDEEIKPFATKLFETWKIGKLEKDNGLLILFVNNQRKVTFETGYGVEGLLPDAITKRIQMKYMIPYFKNGNFDEGMIQGVAQVVKILTTKEASEELMTKPVVKSADLTKYIGIYLIISILVTIFFIYSIYGSLKHAINKEPYSQYKAIVNYKQLMVIFAIIFPVFMLLVYLWLILKLKLLRNAKRPCSECGSVMHKVSEKDEDQYLTTQEQTEERLNTVDYDVWLCDKCHSRKIFAYEKDYTKYTTCPNCHAKAYILESNRVLSESTPVTHGTGEKTYYCANCQKRTKLRYLLPLMMIPPIIGGGGRGGGSFGGGRSGGGGSTSGW